MTSGKNSLPGVLVRATPAAIELWTRAAAKAVKNAEAANRNDWAQRQLTVAAAHVLGIDPLEALQMVSGD